MESATNGSLPIRDNLDVVRCRQAVGELAARLEFPIIARTMLVTAASELARNTLIHGGGGYFSWEVIRDGLRCGLRLSFDDEGPGIPDIGRALQDGWSSGKSLGLGLPGARRLVNEFELHSKVGAGTHIRVTRWHSLKADGLHLPRVK